MNSVFVFGYLSLNELIIDDRFIDLFRKGRDTGILCSPMINRFPSIACT